MTDVSGEAIIDTGEELDDLTKRSVYTAQGVVIETKKPELEGDRSKNYSTVVYSNGTGAFFDADTRVEMRAFVQEPFTPNRSDIEAEPSISQTRAFVARGTVGLCNSKLVAGSNMNYDTPQGSVSIRGRKVVIEASPGVTKISMLEGDSTVSGGSKDLGGHTLKTGEQAIIRTGIGGQANQIQIQQIPPLEMPQLDDKVAMACMAKKIVYFDVRERTVEILNRAGATTSDAAGSASGDPTASTTGGIPNGPVTAFDGTTGGASSVTVTIREIVPVEIVSNKLATEFTISLAKIVPTAGNPGARK
ncbi:MAG: hypothetical protein EXS37_04425 [Opitutus sp.]|nr:hypothetical protein [Opitutus sp.]